MPHADLSNDTRNLFFFKSLSTSILCMGAAKTLVSLLGSPASSDFIWDFGKLPFPEKLRKYFIKIGKISVKLELFFYEKTDVSPLLMSKA